MALACSSLDSPFSHKVMFGEDHPTSKQSKRKSKPPIRNPPSLTPKSANSPLTVFSSSRSKKKKKSSLSKSKKGAGHSASSGGVAVSSLQGRSRPQQGKRPAGPSKRPPSPTATRSAASVPSLSTASSTLCSSPSSSLQSSSFALARVSADSPKSVKTGASTLHGTGTPSWRTEGFVGASRPQVSRALCVTTTAETKVEGTPENSSKGKASATEMKGSPGTASRPVSAATRAWLARCSTTEVLLALNKPTGNRLGPKTAGAVVGSQSHQSGGFTSPVSNQSHRSCVNVHVRPLPHMRVPRRAFESASGGRGCRKTGCPLTVSDVAQGLARRDYRRVVVMSGAGISTASGIPDFR